ncbi:MAG: ABC transporter substrate-binding protein [bacterium]
MKKALLFAVCLAAIVPFVLAPSVAQMKYKEAPMLAELVKAGKLPPVEQRLPKEPKVLSAERNEIPKGDLKFEIGRYGGILRTVQDAPAWNPDIFVMCDEPLLSAPGILAEGIGGNVAKGYEVSPDEKVFTFYLREGLKWSDGVPVTTEDVLFTYEDFLMNEKLTPVFPRWMRSANKPAGKPLKVEIVDKYTFRVSFDEPYGGFPAQLAILFWKGYTELLKPKHYLKQFHIRYTPLEKLEPEIQKESLAKGEWWTLFNKRDITNWELTRPEAIGFPTLNPWMIVKATPTVAIYERNPYYFKVDSAGNQLPYIDGIRSEIVQNVEVSTMRVIAGEVDFLREDATLNKLDLYKENAKKGGYRVQLLDMHVTPADVILNLTHSDPVWRQVVRDVRFRKALSLAIDRKEIIDAVYFGFAELPTAVPSDYDPKEANRLLDEMGLDKRDAEGWRLGPDGKTFTIPFEVAMHAPDIIPVTEMIVEYYKAVGINTTMKVIDAGLQGTRRVANELKAEVGWHHGPQLWWGALWDYVPSRYGPLWNRWLTTAGKDGEEPPADVKRFIDAMDRSIAASPEKRQAAIDEYRRMMYDNLYAIITTQNVKYPLIVSEKLGNVPHAGFAIAANFSGEQLFFKE